MIMLVLPWIIVNAIDVTIIFLLANAIVNKKPVLTVNRILIGVTYAIVLGIMFDFFDGVYTYRIVTTVVDVLIFYLIMKKSFSSTILGYAIFWAVSIIQIPLLLIFQATNLANLEWLFLIIQFLSLIIVIIIIHFKKIPFNRWFRFIEEYLVLKLMFFILLFIYLSIAFYLNFEYKMPYFIFWSLLLIASLVAIWQISSRIIYLRHTVPLRHNDAYHTTLGSLIKAYREEDDYLINGLTKELQTKHEVYLDLAGFQQGKTAENISAFIELKQDDASAEIKQSIRYRQDHSRIGIETIIKLLSILLDNAVESQTSKPIIVDLGVNEDHIQLSVKNEFKLKDPEGINRILMIDGYTTKKINQRGYGLTNLHVELNQIGGKLTTSYSYNQDGKTYYLNMMVSIIG